MFEFDSSRDHNQMFGPAASFGDANRCGWGHSQMFKYSDFYTSAFLPEWHFRHPFCPSVHLPVIHLSVKRFYFGLWVIFLKILLRLTPNKINKRYSKWMTFFQYQGHSMSRWNSHFQHFSSNSDRIDSKQKSLPLCQWVEQNWVPIKITQVHPRSGSNVYL